MLFVLGALAAWAGVVLAALDSPHVRDKTRIERSSIALLAVTAITTAAGAGRALLNWIT
ncbi:hypothetical protein OHA21_20600 [Actinoplanes sp. NBC_00393]|uniref:hypothetical protein n=1 Tax=Actinoplanes sp. NBC_00393 TaxID=2975953 RepID=UPI002E2133B9